MRILLALCIQQSVQLALADWPLAVQCTRTDRKQKRQRGGASPDDVAESTIWCIEGAGFADVDYVLRELLVVVDFSHPHQEIRVASDDTRVHGSGWLPPTNLTALARLRASASASAAASYSSSSGNLVETVFPLFSCTLNTCTGKLSPFGTSCFRVEQPVRSLTATVNCYDRPLVARTSLTYLLGGLLLVSVAPAVSSWVYSYYLAGVSITVLASVFVLALFILRRLRPNTSAFVSVGIAVALQSVFGMVDGVKNWLWTTLWDNTELFAAYVVIMGLIGLFGTHWMLGRKGGSGGGGGEGPGVSKGLEDIFRWTLRLAGYALVAQCTRSVVWAATLAAATCLAVSAGPPLWRGWGEWAKSAADRRMTARPVRNTLGDHTYQSAEAFRLEGQALGSAAVEELMASPHFAKFMKMNADRFVVRRLDYCDGDEEE